jgi:hypothetical protein
VQASWVSFSSVLLVTSTDLSLVNHLADNAFGLLGVRWSDKDTFDTTEVDYSNHLCSFVLSRQAGPFHLGILAVLYFLELLW